MFISKISMEKFLRTIQYEGKTEFEIAVIVCKHFTKNYLQQVDTEEDF